MSMKKVLYSNPRLVVVFLVLVLLIVMLIVGFNSVLFESPRVERVNFNGSRITMVTFDSFAFHAELPVDAQVQGPNVTLWVKFDMFHVYVSAIVDIPYGFAPERVLETYNLDDIPCSAYGANLKLGQVFSILAIFSCAFALVFVAGAMFLRVLLLFVWALLWVAILCISVTNATLLKATFDGFCKDDPVTQIPEFSRFALPAKGSLLYIMSSFTSLLAAFLSLLV